MHKIFALLLILLATSPLLADECPQPVKIDLASTVQLAVQRNLTIKSSQQDIETVEKLVDQAKGQNNLNVNMSANYIRLNSGLEVPGQTLTVGGTTVTIPGQTIADNDILYANIQGHYPVYNAGRIHYRIRQAQYTVIEAENSSADTVLSTALQVARTYLAAIFTRENVRVNQESLKSYQAHLDQAQKARKDGAATEYDVVRAGAAVQDQIKRLTDVQNQYELALANLRTALYLDKNTPMDLQGDFFEIPSTTCLDEAEDTAVESSPILQSISSRSCALLMAEKSIKATAKPQVEFVGFANVFNATAEFISNPQWYLGLQLKQLVFDGGITHARVEEQRSQRVKANIDLQATGNDIKLAVRSAYLDMNTACSAIAAARKAVELARESLRLAERRFREGVGTSLEVLDANVNLLSAQTGLQQSFYQLDSAYLQSRRYIGDMVEVACTAQSAGAPNGDLH